MMVMPPCRRPGYRARGRLPPGLTHHESPGPPLARSALRLGEVRAQPDRSIRVVRVSQPAAPAYAAAAAAAAQPGQYSLRVGAEPQRPSPTPSASESLGYTPECHSAAAAASVTVSVPRAGGAGPGPGPGLGVTRDTGSSVNTQYRC